MYALVNDKSELEIHTTENDLCYRCKNISQELVILHYENTEITNCALFKK